MIKGKVEGMRISEEEEGVVSGVVVDGKIIDADCVVIAMGPWSLFCLYTRSLLTILGLFCLYTRSLLPTY